MHSRWFAVLLVASLGAAACGKAVDSSAGEPDAGDGDGADDDGGDDDDGTVADAGDGDAEDDAEPPGKPVGVIYLASASYVDETGTPVQQGAIQALFGDEEVDRYETDRCEIEMAEGACSVLSCRARALPEQAPDAGAIEVSIESELVTTLQPDENGIYPLFEQLADDFFEIGIQMTASAAGGEVEAFELSGTAPTSLSFDGGVPTSGGGVEVSAGAGYALRWAPGAATDQLRVVLSTPVSDGERLRLRCAVLADLGDLAISPALLSLMPAGALEFETRVESQTIQVVGDYQVSLFGAVAAIDGPTGNWAKGTVTLIP